MGPRRNPQIPCERPSEYSSLVSVQGIPNGLHVVPVTTLRDDSGFQDRLLYDRFTISSDLITDQSPMDGESSEDPRVLRPQDHPDFERQLRRVSCYKKIVSVLSFTLVCLCIIFAVVLLKNLSRSTSSSSENRVTETVRYEFVRNGSRDDSVCLTPECVVAASAIIESIDPSVDPCEDFYGFVCNGWIEKHPIPRGESYWSVTDQKNEDNLEALRLLLERPLDNMASKSERKSQLLYRSCVDFNGEIERLGSKPLENLIASIGGWNLTSSEFDPTTFDLKSKLLLVQKYSTNALFHWYVREGMQNTSQYELFIQQGGITLPLEGLYDDPNMTDSLLSFITTVVKILNGGQGDQNDINRQVQDLVEFERRLADIGMPEGKITGRYLTLDEVDELMSLGPMFGTWKDFFNDVVSLLGPKDGKPSFFKGRTRIWVQHDYINKLADILLTFEPVDLHSEQSPLQLISRRNNTLNNYLTWQAIQPYIGFLSKDYQKAERDFLKSLHGIHGREERWRTCVKVTNGAMGFAVAPLFVRQRFSQEGRDVAYDMIKEIKEAFKSRLENLTWLDPRTRNSIKQKIINTKEMMGYPDFIMNTKELDRHYETFKIEEYKFFENQLRFNFFMVRNNLALFQSAVDKDSWPMTFPPSTVNAFYMYSRNQILFPAGVLQLPLFSEKQTMALNFGHIGTFMGHELLHGFDDTGRLYGPNGQKMKWWPRSTTQTFETKAKCFVRQYTQEIFIGWQVNGKRTLSENIADNGGLISAYQAYERWVQKSPVDQMGLLPGLQFTAEQLIFVGFARAHCSSITKKSMELHLLMNQHSPSHVRVNTAVGNLPEFAEAFQCPINSALRLPPEKRCSLW